MCRLSEPESAGKKIFILKLQRKYMFYVKAAEKRRCILKQWMNQTRDVWYWSSHSRSLKDHSWKTFLTWSSESSVIRLESFTLLHFKVYKSNNKCDLVRVSARRGAARGKDGGRSFIMLFIYWKKQRGLNVISLCTASSTQSIKCSYSKYKTVS